MTYPLLLRGESVISALVFFWEQRIREGYEFFFRAVFMYLISFRFSSLWLGKVTARCMSVSNTARLCCRGWSDLKFK